MWLALNHSKNVWVHAYEIGELRQHQASVGSCTQQHHSVVACEDKCSGVHCLCQIRIRKRNAKLILCHCQIVTLEFSD
jgi:hypothetical protein